MVAVGDRVGFAVGVEPGDGGPAVLASSQAIAMITSAIKASVNSGLDIVGARIATHLQRRLDS